MRKYPTLIPKVMRTVIILKSDVNVSGSKVSSSYSLSGFPVSFR